MTFNVRQMDAADGANSWVCRRDALVETIREAAPDVIGTQELFREQAEYIESHLDGYAWFGSGRYGDHADKHVGIFYRLDALRLTESGDFWLSQTPDAPGSASWGIEKPRHVTWGAFELEGLSFRLFNTHFPYRREHDLARRMSAELLLARMALIAGAGPAIATGDFNSPARGEIHGLLTGALRDAWIDADRRLGPEGTMHGFGRIPAPQRIDWILCSAGWRVPLVETIARQCDGRWPSDHHPVLAILEPKELS